MENTEKNKAPEIETVTPETDNGEPNSQAHNHRIENEVANANKESDDNEDNSVNKNNDQPADSADPADVETVSP